MEIALHLFALGLLTAGLIFFYLESVKYKKFYLLHSRQCERYQERIDDYFTLTGLFKFAAKNNWQLKMPCECDISELCEQEPNSYVEVTYKQILELNGIEEVPRKPYEYPEWRYNVTSDPEQLNVHRTST